MEINRNRLVIAINEALAREDYDEYGSLLDIYYQLLEQEEINDKYISEFIYYDEIPDKIYELITQTV